MFLSAPTGRENGRDYDYSVHLTTPTDDDTWKYYAEKVTLDEQPLWGRSNRTKVQMNNTVGYFMVAEGLNGHACRRMGQYIEKYGIYQPDTPTLRGTIPDNTQVTPVGLNGGRMADALQEILKSIDGDMKVGTLYMDDATDLIDWASDFDIGAPKRANLNPGVPSMRQIIEFKDKFMKANATFTGYDASEGALYVLFMLCMAIHPEAPSMFAIDSFDHALNPRLAKRLTGLDLCNDDIRLFSVSRDKNGYGVIERVQVSKGLLETGQSLSRLWINGRLGGVPELI